MRSKSCKEYSNTGKWNAMIFKRKLVPCWVLIVFTYTYSVFSIQYQLVRITVVHVPRGGALVRFKARRDEWLKYVESWWTICWPHQFRHARREARPGSSISI